MKAPSRRSWTAIGLALASALLVLGLVYVDLARTSPGPLSAPHAAEPELAGRAGCVECHGSGEITLAQACTRCHAPIAAQLETQVGLHGALIEEGAEHCQRCHLEHHGDELALVDARAFAAAGVPERERFRHEGLEFALRGAHLELACERCHPNAEREPLPAGATRFLGLRQDCTSCHEDPHAGAYGTSCGRCHGQEQPFAEAAAFAHTADFPLSGVHAGLACASCHEAEGRRVNELLAARGEAPAAAATAGAPARGCADCHASPHRTGFLARVARVQETSVEQSCARCHPLQGGSFHGAGARLTPPAHASSGFALEGAHAGLSCAACHEGGASAAVRAEPDAPAPRVRLCAECHEAPHREPFLRAAVASLADEPAASCSACHPALEGGFERPLARLEREQHAWSGFALAAPHATLECAQCHSALEGTPAAFAAAFPGREPADCRACHADPHAGAFDSGAFAGQGCTACHDPLRFLPVAFTQAQHEQARFPLHGAHAAVGCWECHRAPREQGAATSVVAALGHARNVFGGTPLACAGCHADVHGGLLAEAPGLRPQAEGCARCHDAGLFADAREGFRHEWSGFELRGAHAELACESCHRPEALPARGELSQRELGLVALAFPRASGRAREDCASCHGDPHAGAFDRAGLVPALVEGRAGCVRCHEESAFDALRIPFDHGAFTGFALEGAHAAASCADCHPRSGDEGRFGAALGTRCAQCHADPHAGQFAREGATDCARCHTSEPGFAAARFDHAQARFALDAAHARLACSACHRPSMLPDGTVSVRFKPLGTECADCHDPRGGVR